MLSVFSCFSWLPVCFLWRNVNLDLPPIFWLGICLFFFLNVELHELLHILKINPMLVTSFADIFFLSVSSFRFGRTLSPRGQFLLYIWTHIQYVGQHIHYTYDITATSLWHHSHYSVSSHPLNWYHHTHFLYDITLAISMASFALYKTSHPHFMTSNHHFYDITPTIFDIISTLSVS